MGLKYWWPTSLPNNVVKNGWMECIPEEISLYIQGDFAPTKVLSWLNGLLGIALPASLGLDK